MKNLEKLSYVVVTAIATAVVVWTLCKDDFSIDRAYLEEMQQELEEKEERISELESDKISDIEQQLIDIEEAVDETMSAVDAIYTELFPESERDLIIDDSFVEQ